MDHQTQEFLFAQGTPASVHADLQVEGLAQIEQGNFALALKRYRPTIVSSRVLHCDFPRVHSLLLIPLVTFQRVLGMILIASERQAVDIAPSELEFRKRYHLARTQAPVQSCRANGTRARK